MKIGFIRPPHLLWQIIGTTSDNFLMPLNFMALAAFLREKGRDDEIKIIDCPPFSIGWKSLGKILQQEKFDIACVSGITIYVNEMTRLLKIVKEINPKTITIGGGIHYTALPEESLENRDLDFIVRGEGEVTLLELILELHKHSPNFYNIKGLAFRSNGGIVKTEPRELIENLDSLPMSAYDLVPVEKYNVKGARFYGGATMEHSRGCAFNCKFCACWPIMGEREIINGKEIIYPKWRTKSPERTVDEIEYLYKKYNKKVYLFVDNTFNFDSNWNREFSELILRKGLKIEYRAYVRPDLMLRDEEEGILGLMVKAGFNSALIGIERPDDIELKELNKDISIEQVKRLGYLVKKKYPQLFIMGTFITGIRSESKESFKKLAKSYLELNSIIGWVASLILTPSPGTLAWEEAKQKGWIEIEDYSQHDWFHPIMSSEYLSRKEIFQLNLNLISKRIAQPIFILKGLFSRSETKRKMFWNVFFTGFRIKFEIIKKGGNPFKITQEKFQMRKPTWYDS